MSKVLIDIADELYTETKDFKNPFPSDLAYKLRMPVANGIVLDNLTNGEVIQKMFPDAKISFEEEWDSYDDGDFCNPYMERFVNVEFEHAQTLAFSLDWWNAKWG